MWNAVGFPDQAPDDGTYIRRALRVLEGLGPQQGTFYDHPYFGQIFLGTIFTIIGYPSIGVPPMPVSVQDLEGSIETLYTIPRILTGILAVIDTFLIYKIGERRYNRNVAFIAAILFAVTPIGWLFRRMYLDPILLPFLLTSILFALYTGARAKQKGPKENVIVSSRGEIERTSETVRRQGQRQGQGQAEGHNNYLSSHKSMSHQNIILLLSSGIFLGLTIFTKIPAITLIPLVGFIIFTNNKKSFKALGIWIIPVFLIPLIWPIHALYAGDFDQWQDGISFQTDRSSKPLLEAINYFYREDSVLLILGLASFVFVAVTRKDFILLIWVVPFLSLFYVLDYVSTFHLIPLIPAFCIGIGVMITDLSDKIAKNRKLMRRILPLVVVSVIAIFGLSITTGMVGKARNSTELAVVALATQHLPVDAKSSMDENVTIVGNSRQFWIFQYIFDRIGYDYKSKFNMISKATLENAKDGTEKVLMIADDGLKKMVSGEELPRTSKAEMKAERLADLYNSTETVGRTRNVEIRTNY
jgi:4-amino-4-deoxy-L-arabinose transferase-like glycosyltransferase